jgi:hypothetical protein
MHSSFSYMFISIHYMFRAPMRSSSEESIVSIRHLIYVTLCRWPSSVQVWFHPNLHTRWSPTQSDIYQMYWCNWFSWWWAHGCSKHVVNWNIHTRKKIVHQVCYLQERFCCRNYCILHSIYALYHSPAIVYHILSAEAKLIRDLQKTKWHCRRLSCEYFDFPVAVIIPPMHSILACH